MNMISNTDVAAFVESHFGENKAKTLGHIGQGGENNKKGADFEGAYAVHTICRLGATKPPQSARTIVSVVRRPHSWMTCVFGN